MSFTDFQINEPFIVNEMDRARIPDLLARLKQPHLLQLLPPEKRRKQWSPKKQSKWIESLLVNIPSSPLYFYETSYNHHELIDGHQRLFALRDFYENNLTLTGLELKPELNGLTYSQLPADMAKKLDKSQLETMLVMMNDKLPEEVILNLKQRIFERLQPAWTE
ncbi:DUF262 domain-containing protein [Laspinema sp. A4]|uniref:DUF262 domain-containing protein n=1 Tax=Laspinema sp. D2d TaxID=2953686 RepID=UPI0021BA5D52|nr:DUF262 domain-containing protein [Laspinema sp. D2d]MCT7986448.1 DUF262 domain-containing protein [Laspinema sp. D2d]